MAKSESPRVAESTAYEGDHSDDRGTVLAALEGRSCPHCDGDGTLERGEYKGNEAVLCDGCETPRVQVWSAFGDD
ncbi:HVO_A0556 family zinc finger protein [Halobiforma nitratireducens]|uniref:Small CPxCG-related zinc finger protein n=1 Tax=Halobiforma nitratireducens JCM 10879 TaxID=1227454 RepID=M0M486_9EURY|nr:HVO_A0556 family zinc finger protein [Halobiforma nitratireducens]EMA40228.1 hypothetical protein C446_07382 [Halobiforma nitratireducens JCM 10879]